MDRAKVNGIELEYEVTGSGEPVLLIGTGPIADSFLPLQSERSLVERYKLIRYRQRGQAGGSLTPASVSFAQHAADAASLVSHLGIARTHVMGHSTGGDVALQLAVDRPDMVQTLTLLEPLLMNVPSAAAFLEKAGPSLAAYGAGDRRWAMAGFLSLACSLDWETCQAVIEKHVPGGVERALSNAHVFFGSYLPALNAWQFGANEASAISQPVLSVLGTETDELFAEGRELLRSWFPQIEECTIEGVGHLLHVQRPTVVAERLAEFLARHSIAAASTAAV